jgi:acyl-CoA synthetase (AMP-forming)/AMP-acid ligase II
MHRLLKPISTARGLGPLLSGPPLLRRRLLSSSVWSSDKQVSSPYADIELPPSGFCPNFSDFVIDSAFQSHSDKEAIVVVNPGGAEDIRTFSDLVADTNSIAFNLRESMNFKAGDVAMLVSPNHADFFAAVHAVMKLNGVLSPANPQYTAKEIGNQLRDCGATVVMAHQFCLENALAAVEASGRKSEISVLVVGDDAPAGSGATPFSAIKGSGELVESLGHVSDDQMACLPYSSGTTGLPKGTILTHRNIIANLMQLEEPDGQYWDKGKEVLISPLPFFHIYGFLLSLNATIGPGMSTLVSMPAFDFVTFLDTVQRRKCTKSHLVPPIILALAKHPIVDSYDLSSLKTINSGAAPLPTEVGNDCASRLKCEVIQGWGMSELSPVGCLSPLTDNRSNAGSSGPPLGSMTFKIADVETGEALGPNEEGEVRCKGPNVMFGYLNNDEANETAFDSDGFMRTGDIGFADEDGFVTFTDRLKELIKYKGFQVAPAELEAVLLTHPNIVDAAVIGVPDEVAGEVPSAFVLVGDGEFDGEEIKAWVAKRTSPHKKLRGGVVQMSAEDPVPKSASGKILRRVLVERNRSGEFDIGVGGVGDNTM